MAPTRLCYLLAACTVAAAWPSAAHAGTAATEERGDAARGFSRTIEFTAARGEANAVTVADGGDVIVIRDTGAPLSVRGDCSRVDEHTAHCAKGTIAPYGIVDAGDGDDSVHLAEGLRMYTGAAGGDGDDRLSSAVPTGLSGGSGDDALTGSANDDHLTGGPGNDSLRGGEGSDSLTGDDAFVGAASARGRDVLDGGPGFDRANYSGHRVPVSLDLARGGQGARGENDLFEGIESLEGGRAADDLRGDEGNDFIGHFDGIPGGGRGPGDLILGRGGDDLLVGSDADDRISGGNGADEIRTGMGRDRVSAGAGNDSVELGSDQRAALPAASVACGRGFDTVIRTGARNVLRRDCEVARVSLAEVAVPRIRARGLVVEVPVAGRRAELSSLPPPCGVRVDLRARARGRTRTLGSGTSGLPGDGATQVVRVTLNSTGRALLARRGPARVLVTTRTHRGCNEGETRIRDFPETFAVDL
jgi:hypothetical protein